MLLAKFISLFLIGKFFQHFLLNFVCTSVFLNLVIRMDRMIRMMLRYHDPEDLAQSPDWLELLELYDAMKKMLPSDYLMAVGGFADIPARRRRRKNVGSSGGSSNRVGGTAGLVGDSSDDGSNDKHNEEMMTFFW